MKWHKVENPPELVIDNKYNAVTCIVTDGDKVGTCDYATGAMPERWFSWSEYGEINPSKITHWMHFPTPQYKP